MDNDIRSLTDQQVVELATQDDQRAFHELVRRYREQMFEVVIDIVGDWDVADSAVGEAFTRAFRALSRGKYNPEYAFGAWLAKIAKNAALTRLQKKKLATMAIKGTGAFDTPPPGEHRYVPLQVPDKGANPLENVLLTEREQQILRALAGLRREHREALWLHAQGVPHKEIARKMGVTVNTVGTWVSRARDKLTETLGSRDSKPPDPATG